MEKNETTDSCDFCEWQKVPGDDPQNLAVVILIVSLFIFIFWILYAHFS